MSISPQEFLQNYSRVDILHDCMLDNGEIVHLLVDSEHSDYGTEWVKDSDLDYDEASDNFYISVKYFEKKYL